MKIKFWGVRGSIPCPGPDTIKYGGNTACIEISLKNPNRSIILDAGSGIRELGNALMGRILSEGPLNLEIFLSHTHWDHIMGFPFFTPLYIPGTSVKVYGPVSCGTNPLETVVGGQLTYEYFPVRQTELAADIKYIELQEGQYELENGMVLKVQYLNHPLLCLGYRFEYQNKILCTAYDTEPFRNIFCNDPEDPAYDAEMASEGEHAARQENRRLEAFYQNADLLIHDAQYTNKEYVSSKIGWGHSSVEQAIETAQTANVKKLALFHHEPMRTDKEIDALSEQFCKNDVNENLEIFFAKEGMEISI